MRIANCLWLIQRMVPAVGMSDSNVCDTVDFFRFGKSMDLIVTCFVSMIWKDGQESCWPFGVAETSASHNFKLNFSSISLGQGSTVGLF